MMGGGHIPGVIPLAVEDVFQTIKNVIIVFVRFILYNESFLTAAFVLFSVQRKSSFSGFLTWKSTMKL